jgi:hypothetical protein
MKAAVCGPAHFWLWSAVKASAAWATRCAGSIWAETKKVGLICLPRDQETNQCAVDSDRVKRRVRDMLKQVESELRGQDSHGGRSSRPPICRLGESWVAGGVAFDADEHRESSHGGIRAGEAPERRRRRVSVTTGGGQRWEDEVEGKSRGRRGS